MEVVASKAHNFFMEKAQESGFQHDLLLRIRGTQLIIRCPKRGKSGFFRELAPPRLRADGSGHRPRWTASASLLIAFCWVEAGV